MTTMFIYESNEKTSPTDQSLAMRKLLVRGRYISKGQRKNCA